MQASVSLLFLLFALSCAQYTVVGYYDLDSNCSGVAYRTQYQLNASCSPSPCYANPAYHLSILSTCVSTVPETPGTLAIYSYTATHNCSGDPLIDRYSLNACIPDERGNFGYLTCEGQYICSNQSCTNCTLSTFNASCTNTSLDSTEYKCYPSPPPTSTSSSSSGATTNSTSSSTTGSSATLTTSSTKGPTTTTTTSGAPPFGNVNFAWVFALSLFVGIWGCRTE